MSIYALDIGWAETANDLRYLQWELLACEEIRGVFPTADDDTLTVLFAGDRDAFRAWARSLEPSGRGTQPALPPTSRQGAPG
jgi:hypothetical protein